MEEQHLPPEAEQCEKAEGVEEVAHRFHHLSICHDHISAIECLLKGKVVLSKAAYPASSVFEGK